MHTCILPRPCLQAIQRIQEEGEDVNVPPYLIYANNGCVRAINRLHTVTIDALRQSKQLMQENMQLMQERRQWSAGIREQGAVIQQYKEQQEQLMQLLSTTHPEVFPAGAPPPQAP
jgi:hypothetical protein